MANIDTCVVCGNYVPEGTMVCWNCMEEVEKMSKKKHKGYLTAAERPLFAPVHAVHLTKKEKLEHRRNKYKQINEAFDD